MAGNVLAMVHLPASPAAGLAAKLLLLAALCGGGWIANYRLPAPAFMALLTDPVKERSSGRLLLLGASGLIGSELLAMARAEGWQLAAPSHAELDIGDREQVMTWVLQFSPDVILNAAGYTGALPLPPVFCGRV